MLDFDTRSLAALGGALLAFGAPGANAGTMQQIDILDIGDRDTTMDGTVFVADPNPTEPSTGTGVFEPFHRLQVTGRRDGNLQNGYNTEAGEPDINYDTKGGRWTDSLRLGDLGVIEEGGVEYYALSLDTHEPGRYGSAANEIDITDMQIYIGASFAEPEPELAGGYTGTAFDSGGNGLLGEDPVWTLDSALNGDVTVTLAAGICTSNGQCGSGHGDLTVFTPTDALPGRSGRLLRALHGVHPSWPCEWWLRGMARAHRCAAGPGADLCAGVRAGPGARADPAATPIGASSRIRRIRIG